jgi:hypothetical protein
VVEKGQDDVSFYRAEEVARYRVEDGDRRATVGGLHRVNFGRRRGNKGKGWLWCGTTILGDKEKGRVDQWRNLAQRWASDGRRR